MISAKVLPLIHSLIAFSMFASFANAEESETFQESSRDPRIISPFQVISFTNTECSSESGKAGTCYTASECSSRGGVKSGSCASGFGVCCTFTIKCGETSRENCTYIENFSPPASGHCDHSVCPSSNDICQLRLDLDWFVITGPSTNSLFEIVTLNGEVTFQLDNERISVNSLASQCLTDSFNVINSASTTFAPICGINSGQHIYIDVQRGQRSNNCVDFDFQLGDTPIHAEIPNRQWSIRVTQVGCNSPSRAPRGCLQYYFEDTGIVQTFNYEGNQHLAFQRQTICVRRSRGQCRICWSAVSPEDFDVSGVYNSLQSMGSGLIASSICCSYRDTFQRGFDCLEIPFAMSSQGRNFIGNSRFCGRGVGLVLSNSVVDANAPAGHVTICTSQEPFLIRFISDGLEVFGTETLQQPNKGFRLAFSQDSNNCSP